MKRSVVFVPQMRCSCSTKRECYTLALESLLSFLKLKVLPSHFRHWHQPEREWNVENTQSSAINSSTHTTNMSVSMKTASTHILSPIELHKRIFNSCNINDVIKYCNVSSNTSKNLLSCTSSYNCPRRFLCTLPSAISHEQLTNVKPEESQHEQEKDCNQKVELKENTAEEHINIAIIPFVSLQSKHQSAIRRLQIFLNSATCSTRKQEVHNKLQNVSNGLLSENKTFVACLARLLEERIEDQNNSELINNCNNTVADCNHKLTACEANVTETNCKEVIGINYALHECINANVSSTCTHSSAHTLRGLLKGCAEQNALGAIAAQGYKYTAMTDVYVMSRHGNACEICEESNIIDNPIAHCIKDESKINNKHVEPNEKHLHLLSELTSTESINSDRLHCTKLHLCNQMEETSEQRLQDEFTILTSKNNSCALKSKTLPVCFPCPLCWRYLCQVNTWKEREESEKKKQRQQCSNNPANATNITLNNKEQNNCSSLTKTTITTAAPLNLFIACDNMSMLTQAIALAKSRALTVHPSAMKITFVLINDDLENHGYLLINSIKK